MLLKVGELSCDHPKYIILNNECKVLVDMFDDY